MDILFLIPLTVGLIAAYYIQYASDEITYLSGFVSVVCLFLSLVLSPWEIQIIILVVSVIIAGRLWNQLNPNPSPTTTKTSNQPEKNPNEYNSSKVNVTLSETKKDIIGTYRGAPVKVNHTKREIMAKPKQITYRGVCINKESPSSDSNQNPT